MFGFSWELQLTFPSGTLVLSMVCVCVSREREQSPRFAQPGTFEFEYSSRWKALDDMERQQREQVDRNIREAKEKLEAEMEAAKHEHQLMMMRQGTHADTCTQTHTHYNHLSYC